VKSEQLRAIEVSPSDPAGLVEAAQAGDQSAFAALHARFERLIHGIALARVPVSEVDDLVQNTFLHAWQHLETIRDGRAFGSWIATTARNLANDFHRHTRRSLTLAEHHSIRRPIDPEAFRVMGSIRAMPEAYRETLLLRLVEGMTGPEIAEQTGLTPDSVRVNLHRGMKMLRERLEGKNRWATAKRKQR
jgi:RNA polymerase sigma-70 factor (ECF subfamily)